MLNFHTHSHSPRSIINISSSFDKISRVGYYSAGLHPWYLDRSVFDHEMKGLEDILTKDNVVAIGECGLDKAHPVDWQLQVDVFIAQIKLANKYKKPLIIHCVRAFEEVLHLLDVHLVSVPVVFHGFTKSLQLAEQIISKGYYLSFGRSIFSPEKAEVFRKVPAYRLFLETDTATLPIDEVYAEAAKIKAVSVDALTQMIDDNIRAVFGKLL